MRRVERLYNNLTPAGLEDVLVNLLSSKNDAEVIFDEDENGNPQQYIHIFHPYQNEAEGLLYKINLYDPLPEFVIWAEDIPLGLAKAVEQMGKNKKNRIITNAVRRIYESVDPDYFLTNGITGKVKWRFDKT